MKIIGLLFLTLFIISCGDSKEKKAVCDAFDAFDSCAQKPTPVEINTCSASAVTDLNNKMGGGKLEVSASQRQEMVSAGSEYGQCVLNALTEASAQQAAGGLGTVATDLSTTAEKEAKEKAALEKFKSSYKVCLSTYTTKGRKVLECD